MTVIDHAASLATKPADPLDSAVDQMVENIRKSPVSLPVIQQPPAENNAPLPAVRSAEVGSDGAVKLNKDGSIAKKRGRKSNAEKAAAGVSDQVPPEPGTSQPAVPAPSHPGVNLSALGPEADPRQALAEAQAAVNRQNVERSATVAARTGVIVLRRLAAIIGGEPIPFEKTADFDQRAEIESAIRKKVIDGEVDFIPAEVELLALAGEYLSKACETEVGQGRVAKLKTWAAERCAWVWGKVFTKRAA